MQRNSQAKSWRTAIQLGVFGLVIVAGLNYENLADQYALATYKPDTYTDAFEDRIGLTPKARATLYRAEPQVNDKASFNRNCNTQPHELELGCFYRNKIYILKIDNQNLAPEMDVVAAHELLHAAWSKFSSRERNELGTELNRVYNQIATDELQERMAGYAKSEPGEETNELHSILATEYRQLSPKLEEHYRKYFTNRVNIVAAHELYQNVFDERRQELERELAAIRAKKGQLGVLNRRMESFRANGQIDQYNALVPSQNRLVDDINRSIAHYRKGVDEFNALSKSLDSQQITDTEAPAQ